MILTRLVVALSFVMSGVLVGGALVSTSGMKGVSGLQSWLVVVALFALCAWPWFRVYTAARRPHARTSAIVFSAVSAIAAGVASPAIAHAPAEGVGYYVIFFVLFVWLACPLLLKIQGSAPE